MIFVLPMLDFLHNYKTNSIKGALARRPIPDEMLRRALNSATMPRIDNTARSGEAQKNQNRQYGNKQKRHHTGLPPFPL